MKGSLKTGISFGLTSASITTVGLMVGLYSSTYSQSVVLGGILIIAVADAFSDAMGIHLAEECKRDLSHKEVWIATLSTFFSKFLFSLSFIIPIFIFSLQTAVAINIIWGLLLLAGLSFIIAKDKKMPAFKIILEHLTLAVLIIFITYYTGKWTATLLG